VSCVFKDFDFLAVWDDGGRGLAGILMGRFSPFDWTGFALGQGIGGFLPPGGLQSRRTRLQPVGFMAPFTHENQSKVQRLKPDVVGQSVTTGRRTREANS
jgi:hypothetical protein